MDNSTLKAHPWTKAYLDASNLLLRGAVILLCGKRGTGKTQMATNLCVQIGQTTDPEKIRYATAAEISMMIRSTFGSASTISEVDAMKKILSPKILVIDECQERAQSAFEDQRLSQIVDRRYGAMVDTILIANLMPNELSKELGSSIMSRANECGGVVVCDWNSFREPA